MFVYKMALLEQIRTEGVENTVKHLKQQHMGIYLFPLFLIKKPIKLVKYLLSHFMHLIF